jgi:hypothetical protein
VPIFATKSMENIPKKRGKNWKYGAKIHCSRMDGVSLE